MIKWINSFLLATSLLACSTGSKKDNNQETRPQGNVQAGQTIYNSTCKSCHGDAGEGNQKFQAPVLVNTEGWYLYRQLMNFRNGLRGDSEQDTASFQMGVMAKVLKDSTAALDVVAYVKSLPEIKIDTTTVGNRKAGESIYQSGCGSCHGPNAGGNEKLNAPRLSGLNAWYLKSQIVKFKKSIRGAHPKDKLGAQMIAMMSMLQNEQSMDDVIAYIQGTKPVSK